MLNTLKATLDPSGQLSFEETIRLDRPTPVLVTLLEERAADAASGTVAKSVDPRDWSLSAEERTILEEFPRFREEHPVQLDSLKPRR